MLETTAHDTATKHLIAGYRAVKAAFLNDGLSQGNKEYEHGNILDGVLMQLHGDAHRARRKSEVQMFRRDLLELYETQLAPAIIDRHLNGYADAAEEVDLVHLGHLLTLVLSARISGIDVDQDDVDTLEHLVDLERTFVAGATIPDARRDHDEIRQEVQAALREFQSDYLTPARRHRAAAIAAVKEGREDKGSLPPDVLTSLLLNSDALGMTDELINREVAFFLESGSHTSAMSLTNSMHAIFQWAGDDEDKWERLRTDRGLVQRCVHEALRLNPLLPRARRRATRDLEIGGVQVHEGEQVGLDTVSANLDPEAYGPDSREFNPDRVPPKGIPRYGLSFSAGMHTCIGRTLAVGLPAPDPGESPPAEGHLFGIVPLIVEALIKRHVRTGTTPPVRDPDIYRQRWLHYPIVYDR